MKIILILLITTFFQLYLPELNLYNQCTATTLSGSINENNYIPQKFSNTVIDTSTGEPIPNATVSIPALNMKTQSDSYGRFSLGINLQGPTILSVNANGYKPFSMTLSQDNANGGLVLGIQKTGKEIIIDSTLRHLGDNNYSPESANSDEFKMKASGISFSKPFSLANTSKSSNFNLKIGSIIGLDTAMAKRLNQTQANTVSSPLSIYLNKNLIGEIKVNGDNQIISIPRNLLKFDTTNLITVRTGKNVYPRPVTDYDDMEFINLILEIK